VCDCLFKYYAVSLLDKLLINTAYYDIYVLSNYYNIKLLRGVKFSYYSEL
jgi:hypothetical protein